MGQKSKSGRILGKNGKKDINLPLFIKIRPLFGLFGF